MMNRVGAPNHFFFEILLHIVYRICTPKSGKVTNGKRDGRAGIELFIVNLLHGRSKKVRRLELIVPDSQAARAHQIELRESCLRNVRQSNERVFVTFNWSSSILIRSYTLLS